MSDIVGWVKSNAVLIALVLGGLVALFVAFKVSKLIFRFVLLAVFLVLAAGAFWFYFGRR